MHQKINVLYMMTLSALSSWLQVLGLETCVLNFITVCYQWSTQLWQELMLAYISSIITAELSHWSDILYYQHFSWFYNICINNSFTNSSQILCPTCLKIGSIAFVGLSRLSVQRECHNVRWNLGCHCGSLVLCYFFISGVILLQGGWANLAHHLEAVQLDQAESGEC